MEDVPHHHSQTPQQQPHHHQGGLLGQGVRLLRGRIAAAVQNVPNQLMRNAATVRGTVNKLEKQAEAEQRNGVRANITEGGGSKTSKTPTTNTTPIGMETTTTQQLARLGKNLPKKQQTTKKYNKTASNEAKVQAKS